MVALAGLLHTAGASSSAACMARRRGTCAVAAAAAAAAARAGRRPSLQPNPKRSCCVFMGPKHFREILAAGIQLVILTGSGVISRECNTVHVHVVTKFVGTLRIPSLLDPYAAPLPLPSVAIVPGRTRKPQPVVRAR